MTKYVVRIKETFSRRVIIEAEDKIKAEEIAEYLCCEDKINLDYEDFLERSVETLHEAAKAEESYIKEVYSRE